MTVATAAARGINWWNIGLWVVQGLLAALYLFAGFTKLTQPIDALATMGMAWAPTLPELFVRFVALMEVLGAIGLILPAATRILPWLTPLSAAGLGIVQVSAIILHATRGETAMTLPMNLVLLALSLFVVWGRTRKAPIAPR
jgi:putative oxidoreductase